jgi:hypothetical protein
MKKKVFFVTAVLITAIASINVGVNMRNKPSSVLTSNIEALSGNIRIFGCCASEGSLCAIIGNGGEQLARDNQQPCLIEVSY